MDEFASAVLVTAVSRVLAENGIATEAPVANGALMPLKAKRRLLAGVAERHGLLPLLRAGLVLPTSAADPAISALAAATTPVDLFERWGRLERFTHSRHRVMLRDAGPTHLVAEHVGPPGAPPQPAEDAVILGLLTGLLATIGAQDVTVSLDAHEAVVVFSGGVLTAPRAGCDTAHWHFEWSSQAPPARAGTTADADTDVAPAARRLLVANPARRWTLDGLATELAVSTRSLQRRLAAAGGFTALLGAARAETAADLLMNSGYPLGIVGFACGYTDQPHFTREFKRRTAMTPAAYRSAFAHPPGQQSHDPLGHRADRPAKATI